MKNILFILLLNLNVLFSQTWQPINKGIENEVITAISIQYNNIVIGTLNGVFLSTNYGSEWVKISNTLNYDNKGIHSIILNDDKILVSSSEGIYLSTDLGLNWKLLDGLGTNWKTISKIAYYKNHVYYSIYPGIHHSTDFGNSWELIASGSDFENITSFSCINNRIFASGSWETYFGQLLISSNLGKSWETVYQFAALILNVVNNNQNIFISDKSSIHHSSDEGKKWSKISDGLNIKQINSLATINNNLLTGTDNGIYISTNIGNVWTKISHELKDKAINLISFFENTIYISLAEGGFYKADISLLSKIDDDNYNNEICIIPNPAEDFIEINIGDNLTIDIGIWDVFGQKATTSVPKAFGTTPHFEGGEKIRIDVSGLTAGMYLVRIGGEVQKFIKL